MKNISTDRCLEIYRVKQLPVMQNRMFISQADARNCPKGDIVLAQDRQTGFVFNKAFSSESIDYGSDYQNEQAVSSSFQKHLDEVAKIIQRFFSGISLVEVGCGKGFFLEHLLSMGFNIKGVDPAYEGNNTAIIKAYFETGLGVSGEAVILRHLLEHIPDPLSFLHVIKKANGGRGKVYIEVPCFDWICKNRSWFDIYYEHVNYFRIQDLKRMFGKVYEAGYLFGGQYLFVVADLSTLGSSEFTGEESVGIPRDFLSGVDICAKIIKDSVFGQDKPKQNAVWGGASRGVIFALFMQRAGATIDCLIDINPAKQGKYIAGSGLLVYSPQDALSMLNPGSNIFIMNSNYYSEIVAQSANRYNYLKVDNEKI